MTIDQLLFKQMVEQFPELEGYWDFEEQAVKVKSAEDLPLSSGEKILMTFFLSVWFNRNVNFDITRAAGYLSTENKRVITPWYMEPFWP
ncbi:hypothetical protein [Serratia sp. M24T3]|uniref:hypothetical protein n=1 Tax=Serratia sp. M24T3 TaxID=932213 RepID=UPI00025BBAA8|nr:hypothetical protein [Serratia sp. M24T3]EIC83131.1 hypothetical protein SPM24T3_18456 [Serratia sp. M24T3]